MTYPRGSPLPFGYVSAVVRAASVTVATMRAAIWFVFSGSDFLLDRFGREVIARRYLGVQDAEERRDHTM